MGQSGILDEGLIGRIKENQRAVAAGIVDPGLELFTAGDRTRRVVREAEINQIHRFTRDLSCEAVLGTDGQIGEPGISTEVARFTGSAGHHVAVDIHRINRVGHGHPIAFAKDVEDVAAVALGAVGHKDLVGVDVAPA